ncbi:putative virion structural protein [Erwinia phage vB_EamM_Phobos]|uniref:virion structural protein n=1 Tax=Erwinia phage vB_EamM_Phobos TaxID=1883377 RepID=UPI00081C976F|nr:virion structural protein [Erwinia phage vB_EamM_Phobos]ANZ50428.1 putative virion structural protein [Erwinia phage vB_EamM_Phobos]
MATTITTAIVDKDRGFRVWEPGELYNAETGTGFMPNNGDLVKNNVYRMLFEIYDVDYSLYTYKSKPYGTVQIYNDTERLGGHYPLKSDKYRIYVDSSKHPATMDFHDHLTFNGPDVLGVRVFRGIDISDSAEVLSGFYKNGKLNESLLPVRPVQNEGEDTQINTVLPGYCIAEVNDGEQVTFVAYADNDRVILTGVAYIIKTNLVMAAETPARTVLDVKLESPFILDSDSKVLTLPINIPIEDIPLNALIVYTDGVKRLPIDNSRVMLNGLRNAGSHDTYYIASNAGQELPLVLSYRLAKGESYAGDGYVNGAIVRDYTAATEAVDGGYSMKLFVVPTWLDVNRGMRLSFFLYNLTRGQVYDASAFVEYTANTVFDPLLYGVKQRLNVQVDVSKVNPAYRAFVHAQSFHITLINPGNELDTNFYLEYVQDGLRYGEDVYAKFKYSNVSFSDIDISCGMVTQAQWIEKLYRNSYPLYDRRTEGTAPEPTHFELHVGGQVQTFAVGEWLNKLTVPYKVPEGGTVVIRWLARTPTDTLQLGLSPMLAHLTT